MKKILIFMLVTVVLMLCLTACGGEDGNTTTAPMATTTIKPVSTTKAPENFDEAFTIRGIAFTKHEFSTAQSAAFVGLTTDDTLELVELGYEGDTVKEVFKTFYLNVEQYDASQKESIKQSMELNFAEAENISCVTITHEISDKYYIMKTQINSLDNADNLKAVIEAGLLDFASEGVSSLQMSAAEDVLVAYDFIKM